MKHFITLLICLNFSLFAKDLPKNLKWETNDNDPVFSSPDAKVGGTFRTTLLSFPLTLRLVGPDSNGAFAGVMRGLQLSLTDIHPNTGNPIPALATHWAYGEDGKTVYYRLNKNAKWSDGTPITAKDYTFAIEFYRSKHIIAPWYNNYYSKEIEKVEIYDDYTISVTGASRKSGKQLHYYYGIGPKPAHFHKLDENWVKNHNWKIAPVSGPYQIKEIKKGKSITLERISDWWGFDLKYNKNRFNVKRIKYTVVRDPNVSWEYFKKGRVDSFSLILPEYWHKKAKGKIFDNGYVHKLWFYTDSPQPIYGMFLNQDVEIFKDKNVRLAFQHSMNIDKVIKTVLRNDYERLNVNGEGYGEYTNTEIKAREFNLDKANEYLEKAGWKTRGPDGIRVKDGKRLSATITYGAPHHNDRLVILKEEAKKAGIELNLKLLDSASSFKAILEKQHEIAYMAWGPQILPQYWGQYHSENAGQPQTNNITNTRNPKLDDLIMKYKGSFKEKERASLSRQIQQEVYEGAAFIPTWKVPYFREAYWRWWKMPDVPATKLSDSSFDLYGTTGGLFWYDKEEHDKTKKAQKKNDKLNVVNKVDETFRVK